MLAVTESHLPVLPLPLEVGEGEERGEGLCCDTQWATAKPANGATCKQRHTRSRSDVLTLLACSLTF